MENLKRSECKINKLKKKRKIIKICIITSAAISIIITVIIACAVTIVLPASFIITLTIISSLLTGFSARFNLLDKKRKLNKECKLLKLIHNKLNYVIKCNGNLTKEEYDKIIQDIVDHLD